MLWLRPVGWVPEESSALLMRYSPGLIKSFPVSESLSRVEDLLSVIYWVIAGRSPEEDELDENERAVSLDPFNPEEQALIELCAQVELRQLKLVLRETLSDWYEVNMGGHRRKEVMTLDYSLSFLCVEEPAKSPNTRISIYREGVKFSFQDLLRPGLDDLPLYSFDRDILRWLCDLLYESSSFQRPSEALDDRAYHQWEGL